VPLLLASDLEQPQAVSDALTSEIIIHCCQGTDFPSMSTNFCVVLRWYNVSDSFERCLVPPLMASDPEEVQASAVALHKAGSQGKKKQMLRCVAESMLEGVQRHDTDDASL